MIIDFHTHCFPETIAARALEKLSYTAGGLEYYTSATTDGIRTSMAREGVDRSVILSIATNAHQQESVNNFAAEINNSDDLIAFGSVYPFADNALEELERIKALGLPGIKLHPEYQEFFVDDERLRPLYRKISELGLITVFHAGEDYGYSAPFHCMPENLRRALSWFDAPVVAAHWGGMNAGEEVIDKLCGLDLYFDTSFGYAQLPRSTALKIVEKHGADKILFGTDSPWHTKSQEMRLLNTLELNDDEMEKILSGNAKKLLGMMNCQTK